MKYPEKNYIIYRTGYFNYTLHFSLAAVFEEF